MNTPTNRWQLQDAKARLSEVVRRALTQGPQHISVRGEPGAVLLSASEYQRLVSVTDMKLLDVMAKAPVGGFLDGDRSVISPVRAPVAFERG